MTDQFISTNARLISSLMDSGHTSARKRNWLAWLERFLVSRHRRSMNG